MRKIIEYALIHNRQDDVVEERVNALLIDGWCIYGPCAVSVSIGHDEGQYTRTFCQTMVMYEED